MLECCPWCDMPVQMHEPEEIGMMEIFDDESMPPRTPLDVWFPGLRNLVD